MSKVLKYSILAILGALFSLCVGLLLFTSSARAENITTTGLSDDNYLFAPGAAVPIGLCTEYPGADDFDMNTATTMLSFGFKLNNFDYENLSSQVPHPTTWYGVRATNVFIYEFTLFRGNKDGDGAGSLATGDPQSSILVVIFPDADKNFYGYVAEKSYYTTSALNSESGNYLSGTEISLSNETYYDYIANTGATFEINSGSYEGTQKTFGKNYTIKKKFALSYNNLAFEQSDGLALRLIAEVISPFQYHFVRARYCFVTVDYAGVFSTTEQRIYGEIYSSSRSVANVLQRMRDAGVQFKIFGAAAGLAEQILAVENTQRVRIKYLTEIEGTPYATHNYAYVDVPVLQETIYISDVEAALGISLRKCLDSNAYCFQKTTDTDGDVYELHYLKNVWLRAATVDGNPYDYFLDINQSYKEIYRPYVESEILSDDVYEWIFSTQMLNKFPALSNYRFNEIYGYFGLVVVPETYTLNSALKTMFDVSTSKIGVISNFTFERMLSYTGYQRLLSNYNYGFLSKAWSEVSGFVTGSEHRATYYVVYSEPGTENALIGEGGQTDAEDPGSIVENEVIKPVGGVIGNVWNGVVDFFSSISSNTKTILYVALGVVAIMIIIKIYNGSKGTNKRRRK